MNAVLAIIANGGRAIVVFYREGVEINYFVLYFIDSTKTLDDGLIQPLLLKLPGVGYTRPSKPCCWRGKLLHHGGDVCVLCLAS